MKNTLKTISWIAHQGAIDPVFAFRPTTLKAAARFFLDQFQGDILYAVKTNPEPHITGALLECGVRSFDVASLQEVQRIRAIYPDAVLYYMHPVKSRHSIREAYHTYGVRHFSLDCPEELTKILEETNHADDLGLHMRVAIPNTYAELNLSEKFGINLQDAPAFLQQLRAVAREVGVCFHVGSQCMHPDAYRIAMRMVGKVVEQSEVKVNYFNVGGGFPSVYPGMVPPPLSEYFNAIHEEFAGIKGHDQMTLLCEPGRAIVAESTSVIVRVDMRKGNTLYINDGAYGSLFDAATPKFIFPVRLLNDKRQMDASELQPFSFYGPTCDSLDFMKGPFYLPETVSEGDYIEIGQIGAYGRTLATGFNGFGHAAGVVEVSDAPLMSMYSHVHVGRNPLEVIAA